MKRKKINYGDLLSDVFALIAGAALFGLGMDIFITPSQIILGGCTGISSTINHFFSFLPVGGMIFLLNVPLVIWRMKESGFKALIRTIIGIISISLMTDLLDLIPSTVLPRVTDPLSAGLMGGAVCGAASAFLLTRGFSIGGTDLAAYMLSKKLKKFSAGRFMLVIDFIIIVGSALVTKNYPGILYSLICIVIYSMALDLVLGGSDKAKSLLIFSNKYAVIADAITKEFGRGVTVFYGRGWYTKEERCALMCVVKRQQEYQVKTLIKNADPDAFIIISDATQVLGFGFKPNE